MTAPIIPSRGFDAEAGHEDRARADSCRAEFWNRHAAHGCCCEPDYDGCVRKADDDGCAPGSSSVAGWCFVGVFVVIVAALAAWGCA